MKDEFYLKGGSNMNPLKAVILYILIAILIMITWQLYELATFGEIIPDAFDSIITIVLSLSLTTNVFLFKELKRK